MNKPPRNLTDREYISYVRYSIDKGHIDPLDVLELIEELIARLEARQK